MRTHPKILIVSNGGSTHALSWVDMLIGSAFDVRMFSTALPTTETRWIPQWKVPTYVLQRPESQIEHSREVLALLPAIPRTRTLVNLADDRYSLSERWLRRVIKTWRPQIVHSMPLHTGGKLTRSALTALPRSQWPRWVSSSWGSDLYLGCLEDASRANIEYVMRHCDGFMADCRRDLDVAVREGLPPDKLAFHDAVPGTGGLQLEDFEAIRTDRNRRNLIVIPKAFEREHANRTFTVLEALRLIPDALDGYEIHLLMCSRSVRTWLRRMPEWLQQRCHCIDMLPQSEFFSLLGRARVLVAPSLSDGTPNVMLEAMAAGAIPLMSPLDSIREWIDDGRNGLLAHALYPDQIASSVRRALTDDDLFERASRANWTLVHQRANREVVRNQVISYYLSLIK